jgi:hypothetical protein
MKKFILFISLISFLTAGQVNAQLTQAAIQRTAGLEITVYAKPDSDVASGTNVSVLFAVSLPDDGNSPASLTGSSLIGGTFTAAETEIIGGRYCYPFAIETPSSTAALNANSDNPIAVITFPADASGEVVQINDASGSGTTNVYWYISYFGSDGTNYAEKFYGTNATNDEFGDSFAEADLPLPVSLVSFDARKSGERSSYLSWITASEINSSHFSVQRSYDKKSWSTIGKVQAAGNSQLVENYQFIDENVYNGIDNQLAVYYRLQMVDRDGQLSNSPIERVVFGTEGDIAKAFESSVYPNPASDGIYVDWSSDNIDQPTLIELYDVTGKRILQHAVAPESNQEYIDFTPVTIQPGLYLLRLIDGTEALSHQQIVIGQRN